jgi:hypothetical protein
MVARTVSTLAWQRGLGFAQTAGTRTGPACIMVKTKRLGPCASYSPIKATMYAWVVAAVVGGWGEGERRRARTFGATSCCHLRLHGPRHARRELAHHARQVLDPHERQAVLCMAVTAATPVTH